MKGYGKAETSTNFAFRAITTKKRHVRCNARQQGDSSFSHVVKTGHGWGISNKKSQYSKESYSRIK